jgi:hypothetical protein
MGKGTLNATDGPCNNAEHMKVYGANTKDILADRVIHILSPT